MAKRRAARRTNKSDFVRALPENMPATEVVARAKEAGLTLSAAYVHSIRTIARRGRPTRLTTDVIGRRVKIADLLLALAAEVGLSRAIAVLEADRAKVAQLLGPD